MTASVLPLTDSSGERHILATTKVPYRDETGRVTHLFGIISDITKIKLAEETLRDANEELERRVLERTAALADAQEELIRKERLAVLGQLAPGLSTKISTNSATLTYQLTDKVTVSATFENQQGVAGQQQGADTTASGGNPNDATNRSEFSIGYRFAKSWLVRGTVGVGLGAASGIDLLFQHRY